MSRHRLTQARAERWRGLKQGTRGRYLDTAARYELVCEHNSHLAWPVAVPALEAFVVTLGQTLLPSSVGTEVNRLRLYCSAMGLFFPPAPTLHGLRLIMRGLQRSAWRATQRATPVRAKHLLRFTSTLRTHAERGQLGLAAMLWLGHSALLRAKELLNLRHRDVLLTRYGVRVTIMPRYSKTSLGGEGESIWVPRDGSLAYSFMQRWLSSSAGAGSDLLWGSYPYHRWLKQMRHVGSALGLPGVSTHSLRAGGCTDLLEGGASHELVKRQGRWRSECFLQYWRPEPAELSAHLGAAFAAASRQFQAADDPVLAAAGAAARAQRECARQQRKQLVIARKRVRWQQ